MAKNKHQTLARQIEGLRAAQDQFHSQVEQATRLLDVHLHEAILVVGSRPVLPPAALIAMSKAVVLSLRLLANDPYKRKTARDLPFRVSISPLPVYMRSQVKSVSGDGCFMIPWNARLCANSSVNSELQFGCGPLEVCLSLEPHPGSVRLLYYLQQLIQFKPVASF